MDSEKLKLKVSGELISCFSLTLCSLFVSLSDKSDFNCKKIIYMYVAVLF